MKAKVLLLTVTLWTGLLAAESQDLTFEEQKRLAYLFDNKVNETLDTLIELIQTKEVRDKHIITAHQIRTEVPEDYKFSLLKWVEFTKKYNPPEDIVRSITQVINFSFALHYGYLKPRTKMSVLSPLYLSIKPTDVFSKIMEFGPNILNDAFLIAYHYSPQELISKLSTDKHQISEHKIKAIVNNTEFSPQQALDMAITYNFSSTTEQCKEVYNECRFRYEQCYLAYLAPEGICNFLCKQDEVDCLKNNGIFTLRQHSEQS